MKRTLIFACIIIFAIFCFGQKSTLDKDFLLSNTSVIPLKNALNGNVKSIKETNYVFVNGKQEFNCKQKKFCIGSEGTTMSNLGLPTMQKNYNKKGELMEVSLIDSVNNVAQVLTPKSKNSNIRGANGNPIQYKKKENREKSNPKIIYKKDSLGVNDSIGEYFDKDNNLTCRVTYKKDTLKIEEREYVDRIIKKDTTFTDKNGVTVNRTVYKNKKVRTDQFSKYFVINKYDDKKNIIETITLNENKQPVSLSIRKIEYYE